MAATVIVVFSNDNAWRIASLKNVVSLVSSVIMACQALVAALYSLVVPTSCLSSRGRVLANWTYLAILYYYFLPSVSIIPMDLKN